MSDEYPEYVNTNYNDAFIAQLNTWNVAADPATQTVNAPGNFAGGAGDVISVDGGRPECHGRRGPARRSTYDGATPLLTARTPVTPGRQHALPDDLRPGRRDPRQRRVRRQPALREHRSRRSASRSRSTPTTARPASTWCRATPPKLSGDLSKLIVPAECNLPPGSDLLLGDRSQRGSPRQPAARSIRSARPCWRARPLAKGAADIPPSTVSNVSHEDDQGRHQRGQVRDQEAREAARLRPRRCSRRPRSCGPRARSSRPRSWRRRPPS